MQSPRSQQTSPINKPDKWPAKAVALALALHTPVFLNGSIKPYWEARDEIAHVKKEQIKSILLARTPEKSEYVKKLKEDLENDTPIDLGDFYLRTEYLEGFIDAALMGTAKQRLSALENDLRVEAEERGLIKTLRAITESNGEYSEVNSYLSSVLMDEKGNCEAREKFAASLIHRLYPRMKIAYQFVKIAGINHTRALVEIDGQWHNMEEPEEPMSEKELEGTVIYQEYDYIRGYIGERAEGKYIKPTEPLPPPVRSDDKLHLTDSYLGLPLPKGITSDDIKDLAYSPSATSDSLGRTGVIGSIAPINKNQGSQEEAGYGQDYVRDAIELEILTAEVIEMNRQRTQATLDRWEFLSQSDDDAIRFEILQYLNSTKAGYEINREIHYPDPEYIHEDCINNYVPLVRISTKLMLKFCKEDKTSGELSCENEEEFMRELEAFGPQYSQPFDNSLCDLGQNLATMLSLQSEAALIELGL